MAQQEDGFGSKPSLKRINTNVSLLGAVPRKAQTAVTFHVDAHVPVLVGPDQGNPVAAIKRSLSMKQLGDGDVEQPSEKQILFGVEGRVDPGCMLALMGPSGSGKSSLLTVLGGRSTARITGHIHFNGKPLDKRAKRKLGFVTQDDLLYATLTTYETLHYAALLRLPRSWSRDEKLARVDMVLAGLGLNKCRDTLIGNAMMRGVSGGERKRVSIGHELLINPSVVFLDEPTSGLDSTTALKLIHTLRSLASGGRTIIASIHQPSSRLYQEFDKLMLLSEGHTMYYGDAQASAYWFARHGVPVPFGVSVPDHLLDLACGDLRNRKPAESQAIQQRLIAAWEHRDMGTGVHGIQPEDFPSEYLRTPTSAQTGNSTPMGASGNPLYAADESAAADITHEHSASSGSQAVVVHATTAQEAKEASVVVSMSPDSHEVEAEPETPMARDDTEHKWAATWFDQIRILLSRCIRTRRMDALSIQRIAEVIIPAVLAGLFWFQLGGSGTISKQDALDLSGLLFFQVLFMGFSPLFQALFAFPGDFAMLIKERQSGMYRLSSYYLARTLSDIPMDCLIPSVFTWIIYWMSGLRIQAGAFFLNWATIILSVLVAQSLGLFMSASINNPRTALASATVIMLTFMLVSGFYVQNIPVWIRWMKYLSFVYYSYNLMLKIEFKGRGYSCEDYYADNPNAPPGQTWCSVSQGDFLPVDVDKNPALEACMLIAFLLLFRVGTYVMLNRRTSFKQK